MKEKRTILPNTKRFRALGPDDLELKSVDQEHRIIWHPITREVKDRMGDVVRLDGADMSDFMRKPAVLYGHDYRSMNPVPIIAENIGFERQGDKLYAGSKFLPVETPGMSQGLKDLINDNWILQVKKLLGWSIGFIPTEWDEMFEEKKFVGYDFKRWSLLEYSSVVIPAHQDAVNDALKSGSISGAAVKYFDQALKLKAEEVWKPEIRIISTDSGSASASSSAPLDPDLEAKPYPNNHACELDTSLEVVGSQKRKHEGKEYTVRIGKDKEGKSGEHSYLYPKEAWSEAEAKAHCKDHGGSFVAATGKCEACLSDLPGEKELEEAAEKPVDTPVNPPATRTEEGLVDDSGKAEDAPPEGKPAEEEETQEMPQQRDADPEEIDTEEEEAPPEEPQVQNDYGGIMVEKIINKLSKGEELTPEEKEFWAKYQNAMAPKPATAPARKLSLVDAGSSQVRSIRDIMERPHTKADRLNDAELEIQQFAEDAYIVATLLGKDPRQLKLWDGTLGRSAGLRKALDAATATEGAEWIPTLLSADFIQKFRLQAKVAALFNDFAMPSNPWKMPYFGGLSASNFYYVGESTSDEPSASPPSTPSTGDQTLTAKKLKARVLFSDELMEDSIVPVLETLRADLATAGTEVIEDVILNGQASGAIDSDVTDSKDRRFAWDGLRYLCPSGTKGSLATFTAASHIAAFRTLMGKYGINPNELAFITGGVGYSKFLALTETITVDKYGPQAVVLTGELGKLLGIPIIISEYIRENLNATGVYDGSTTTKTEVLIVNRRGFMLGTRGGVKLTFKAEAEVDQNQLIMSFRKAFQPRWTPGATVPTIAIGYNVA